jgi:hypothetical protein
MQQNGKFTLTPLRNAYGTTNVTTSAWTQLTAALPSGVSAIQVFDTSGQSVAIGVGAPGAEVHKLTIGPNSNGMITPMRLEAGQRISVKALSATASTGELNINLFQ